MNNKILVLCYMVSPTRGSEYSVAWNYIRSMSANNKLDVIYGASGEHMGDTREIEEYVARNCIPNVTFHKIATDRMCECLNALNKKGVFRYSFYFAFRYWHYLAYREAVRLCAIQHFDLIHFLGPIGYREPGFVYKINLPYIWGPIGGTNFYPHKMFGFLPLRNRIKYGFRNFVNYLQLHFSFRVREVISRADILIASTTSVQQNIKEYFDRDALYCPENGIVEFVLSNANKVISSPIKLLCVGRLDSRKNFILALEALAKAKNKNHFRLTIVGDGPERTNLERHILKSGLKDIVSLTGAISRSDVQNLFENSDVQIITSLGEGNPTVIWEAMTYGVPTLTVDHCGMHDTVDDDTGWLLPVSYKKEMVDGLANLLDHIADNPDEILTKSKNVLKRCEKYNFDKRVLFFEDCYEKAIKEFNARNSE